MQNIRLRDKVRQLRRPPWRIAIVGCGRMGLAHARRLAADPRSVPVAFCDSDRHAAARLRGEFASTADVCESLDAVLTAEPHAVIVSTPTSLHHDQITQVLQAGLHVLAEKPLAGNRGEITALVSLAAEKPQQHCLLGYQRRFWRNYQFLREQVHSGPNGAVQSVTFTTGEAWEAGIDGTWRNDPAANYGGFLGDAGSHKIDAVMYVTGRQPLEVYAVSQNSRSDVPVVTSVCARLDGDVPLTMAFTGNAHAYFEELRIHCERADLVLRDGRVGIARDDQLQWIDLPAGESGPTSDRNPVSGFLGLLEGSHENVAPFSCAVPVYDVTAAVLESSRTGRAVVLAGRHEES